MIASVFLPFPVSYASIQVKVAIGYAPSASGFGSVPARFSSSCIPLNASEPASIVGLTNCPLLFCIAAAAILSFIYD